MKKPKRIKVTPPKVILKKAEKRVYALLSKLIRAMTRIKYGGMCPLCKRGPLVPMNDRKTGTVLQVPAIQCAFHFCRSKICKATRLELHNVIGSCFKCNWQEYREPDPSRAWFIKEYGAEAYLKLVEESQLEFEFTIEYLTRLEVKYTKMLEEFAVAPDSKV